jgi:hypothetical protein
LLAGSNDETQFPGMPDLIGVTLNFLNPVAERARSLFVVKVLRQKTMLVSLLRCDERMLVTPYLISMTTPESPRLLVEGATTSRFQVYLGELSYLFERAEPRLAAGRCFGRSDHRGRGKRYRAVGARVAQDTTHPSIKRLLS